MFALRDDHQCSRSAVNILAAALHLALWKRGAYFGVVRVQNPVGDTRGATRLPAVTSPRPPPRQTENGWCGGEGRTSIWVPAWQV